MAEYQEVEGEADEDETPEPQLTPKERVYDAVLTYKKQEFQGLKEFAAALGSEQTESLATVSEFPGYPELELLPQYLLRVKKLISKTKELDRRKEQVMRLYKELFPA